MTAPASTPTSAVAPPTAPGGWFDSHVHLDLLTAPTAALAAARARGVTGWLVPGVEGLPQLPPPTRSAPGVLTAVGVHPWHAPRLDDERLAAMEARLGTDPRCVAVGEIGLDWMERSADRRAQRHALERQLTLAAAHDATVLVHLRRGWTEFLDIALGWRDLRWIFHGWSGPPDLVALYLRRLPHCWFAFGSPPLRPNARRPVASLRATPLNRLLVETDAPFLPPPGSDEPNAPVNLVAIAEGLATLRGIPADELRTHTAANIRAALSPWALRSVWP